MSKVFVFLIIFFVVRSVIRTVRGPKKPSRPAVPSAAPVPPEVQPEMQSQEGRSQNPDYVRADSGVYSQDPRHHHHKEQVVVQAGGYAGEGDPDRYQEREICCEDDHTQSSSVQLALPDKDALISAVIWSEILGKPKAYRAPNGGARS